MSVPPSGRNPTLTPETKHAGGDTHECTTSKHPQAPADIKSQQPPDPKAAPKPSTLNQKHTKGDHSECAVHRQTPHHTEGRHPPDSTATPNPGQIPAQTSKPERTRGDHQECNAPHPQTPRHTKGRHLPNSATTPKPGKQTTSGTQTSPRVETLEPTDNQTPPRSSTDRTISAHLQRRDDQQPQGTNTAHLKPTDKHRDPTLRPSTEGAESSQLRQTSIEPTLRTHPCRPNQFQERRQPKPHQQRLSRRISPHQAKQFEKRPTPTYTQVIAITATKPQRHQHRRAPLREPRDPTLCTTESEAQTSITVTFSQTQLTSQLPDTEKPPQRLQSNSEQTVVKKKKKR